MNLFVLIAGTKNLTQQSYALVRLYLEGKGGVFYWLFDDEHSITAAAHQLKLMASLLQANVAALPLDPLRQDFPAHLHMLGQNKPGIYLVTKQGYQELGKWLALLNEEEVRLSVGQSLTPVALKKRLADLGYSDDPEEMLFFTAKGSVVDLQNGISFLRFLFDEDKIEQIKNTQSGDALREAVIFPAELPLDQIPLKRASLPDGTVIASDQMKLGDITPKNNITFLTFASGQNASTRTFSLAAAGKYDRQFKKFAIALADLQKENVRVAIASVDTEVTKTALERENVDLDALLFLEQSGPAEGFIDQEANIALFTHAEMFGRQRKTKKREERDQGAFLTKLQLNDYVVHEDHGVARYKGLVQTEIEGHQRENLVLEYAKGDKLYVPVELAYKVDKYVGEAKPALQRLSGTSWIKLSRKASQDSQQFARELLKIYANRSLQKVDPYKIFTHADEELHQSFGFEETLDQEQAIKEVYADLALAEPMDRLVVGDVGFGKTEVAIRAAYQAVLNGKQVALLCPTTLLAQQHYNRFKSRLEKQGVRVEMLSRFTGKTEKQKKLPELVRALKKGEIDIAIGTHRLLSKDIDFHDIGLVIIDEEQRFGVRHKEKLKRLRSQVHILTLSATPIPRTLYFSLSGLRDISLIKTPPKGRQPIETAIQEYNPKTVKQAIEFELKRGGQVFYLYNKVQTIVSIKRKLQELLGTDVRIDIVHGQMPPEEMARVANEFDLGKIDVLLCTTIIENGLDLPNANTLIVHDATRFGIGQLYQIRGRIGRGRVKAYACFFYPEAGISGVAAKRLQILEEAKELGSGFELAMRDLEMRGMGQMLGKRQHGHVQKVGLSLYGRLLRQAVEELESGESIPAIQPVVVNLPLDYGIPESLIADPAERLKLYRRLSSSESLTELAEIIKPYRAQIDQLPEQDKQLFAHLEELLELRIELSGTVVKSVDYQETTTDFGSKKQLAVSCRKLTPEMVDQVYAAGLDFRVSGDADLIFALETEEEAVSIAKTLAKTL